MSAIPKICISEKEYLDEERKALNKSEYYKGEIFAMAGATKVHNRIVASVISAIGQYLKGKDCYYYPSDLRVHNSENTLYTYPDVIIVCGKEEYLDDEFDTLLNPTVLIEVLSPSTENYDRGTKFKLYRSIPSLKNYILVSSTEYAAEVYTRIENDEWKLNTTKEKTGNIHISAIDFDLSLADVYAQVDNLIPAE
ncbi:MAG TPA: Uma2 family endonuclease [Hanamia sp.]|nr:Uma2 family endonuclease [Hanamia sp.]